MRAALIHSFGGIEKVEIDEVSIPLPHANEVQIAIEYAGVNPVDWKIAEGMLKTRMDYQFPIILGWDASGMISAVGEEVTQFTVGDPVFAYCRKKIMQEGSFAEYITLEAQNVAKKPLSLSFAEAASIPLSCLTAWQALYDAAKLKKGETVLIHAGAGGVGGFAIQLAKLRGAHVITTASAANHTYVQMLGADEVIDYTKGDFRSHLHDKVDVLLDTVGGKTLQESYEVVKPQGRLVTIAGVIDQDIATTRDLWTEFVFVHPDGETLAEIATLLDEKKLTAPTVEEMPFDTVERALGKSRQGHTQGKIVLKIHA